MADLKSQIESLLFITNQPLTVKRLATVTKADKAEIEKAVKQLTDEYNQKPGGIKVQVVDDKIQMATSPDNAKLVKDFIKEETTGELSKASLETLTVIAYRGPISRAELEQIRGVNCAVILRHLLIRGLIESTQDKKQMQTVYNITHEFLHFLGINQQSELPEYEKLHSNEAIQKVLTQGAQPNP